jgi:hypothetical protein
MSVSMLRRTLLIDANGNITTAANADRPHQFKLTGMYLVLYHDIIVSGNFSAQQGPPVTRQINRAVRFATNHGACPRCDKR